MIEFQEAMYEHKLQLFNSFTKSYDYFNPIEPALARIYSCGPTVYSFQHIGNMRAYVFTDTLGRVLRFKGYKLNHIINITDVGHLTSDADTGDDKLEKAAAGQGRSAYEVARFYTATFWRDIERLNINPPTKWTFATEHIGDMIEFARRIAPDHCYLLKSGLYFDITTVPNYGSLARAEMQEGEGRIEEIEGKRHAADFAIWRKSSPDENRQMEWNSPWGRGAPGWHLECSAMSLKYLGQRFDIHTGGIDHREIHHPNEIAQNQAFTCSSHPGATIWMHNNFLIDRSGKLSKSAGGALLLENLVERGYHPLAFRLMCLSAHYRSPLEFSFESLSAALSRYKRMVTAVAEIRHCEGSLAEAATPAERDLLNRFDEAISDDLMTPQALPLVEEAISRKDIPLGARLRIIGRMDEALGLRLLEITRTDLRVRPVNAVLHEEDIKHQLGERQKARAGRNFDEADRIRRNLVAGGVEVMDGDPHAWDWRIEP